MEQRHGKEFEDIIKAQVFRGASDGGRLPTSGFDVEPRFDRTHGIPTSVKSTKGNTIHLSDARRFFDLSCVLREMGVPGYRMVVGVWQQLENLKIFSIIYEFFISEEMHRHAIGEVPKEFIEHIHDGISLRNFPEGSHHEARLWVNQEIESISEFTGLVRLNPKIDSRKQRRLQCSISIKRLARLCEVHDVWIRGANSNYRVYADLENYGSLVLPIRIRSGRRFQDRQDLNGG